MFWRLASFSWRILALVERGTQRWNTVEARKYPMHSDASQWTWRQGKPIKVIVSLTQLVNLTSEYYEPERYIRRHQITIRWDLCDKIRRPQYGANSLALRPPINKRSSEPLRHIISDDLTPNFLYESSSNLRNSPPRLTHSAGTTLSTPAPVAS